MRKMPNAQYNLAEPGSLSVRVANRVRHRMFAMFMAEFDPSETEQVLDIGVTSAQQYSSSNYFETLYPYKHRITAAGLDDARFLEDIYPSLHFQFADVRSLPFDDNTFDTFTHPLFWNTSEAISINNKWCRNVFALPEKVYA